MVFTSSILCLNVRQRYVLAVMTFLGSAINFSLRNCLAIAIVDIVDIKHSNANSSSLIERKSTESFEAGKHNWDENTQGIILSSFYWGYMILHIPGSFLVWKFGAKYVYAAMNGTMSIITLLTPTIIQYYDWTGLIVARIILGMAAASYYSVISSLVGKWAPPKETSVINSIVVSGTPIGITVSSTLSGILIKYSAIGWPCVFYVFGSIGLVWCVVWLLLCYNSPNEHPFISTKEKLYLQETMSHHSHGSKLPIPWKHLLLSPHLWALIITWFGSDWLFFMMSIDLPKYMSSVMGFSIEANGIVSSIPHITGWISGMITSIMADWMISTNRLSRTHTRKMFNSLAAMLSVCFIMAAVYTSYDRTIVMTMFALSGISAGMTVPSINVNSVDLSPNFCGFIMAIVNGIGCVSGILVPYVVGVLTPNQTLAEWKVAFWITFGVSIGSSLIFIVWGDAETQYWNDPAFREHLAKNPKGQISKHQTHESKC